MLTFNPRFGPALAVFVTAAVLLSGCSSAPAGIQEGDLVTVRVTVMDPATGATLLDNATGSAFAKRSLEFAVGTGMSGLGEAFEAALAGLGVNDTLNATFNLGDFSGEMARNHTFGPYPVVNSAPLDAFIQSIGEPEVGMEFEYPPFYKAVVEAIDDDSVIYRIMPEPGQRNPVAQVGAFLVTTVSGDNMTQALEPDVGATFIIMAGPGGPTPLDLPAGSYRTVGATDTQILFAHHPGFLTDWVGRDVHILASVVSVSDPPTEAADSAGHEDDGHSHGESGHDGGHSHGESGHDDGHSHDDGHTH